MKYVGPSVFGAAVLVTLASVAVTARAAEQMTICHDPAASETTLTIDVTAWPPHQAHGDTEGACTASQEPAFQVVLCDGREGKPGRVIQLSETGRVVVQETECS